MLKTYSRPNATVVKSCNLTPAKPGIPLVKQIFGGYFLGADGNWYVLNPQAGFVCVDVSERAFQFYKARQDRAEATGNYYNP
jgi:hypothetical protein